jgi:hypothetical protein
MTNSLFMIELKANARVWRVVHTHSIFSDYFSQAIATINTRGTKVYWASNWDTATQVPGEPNRRTAGSSETFIVLGLSPGSTYYFAVKTRDEVLNESALSNVVSATASSAALPGPPGKPVHVD